MHSRCLKHGWQTLFAVRCVYTVLFQLVSGMVTQRVIFCMAAPERPGSGKTRRSASRERPLHRSSPPGEFSTASLAIDQCTSERAFCQPASLQCRKRKEQKDGPLFNVLLNQRPTVASDWLVVLFFFFSASAGTSSSRIGSCECRLDSPPKSYVVK